MNLDKRRAWIFDMDGTLTVPMHDFDWLRKQLSVPASADILQHIAMRPPAEAAAALQFVHEWELDIADRARPQPDAVALLHTLRQRGCQLGVVTRNTAEGARRTLRAAGLASFFRSQDVLGRDDAPPKPSPEALLRLLNGWNILPHNAVMVGDWVYDTDAGRAAGTATVLVVRDNRRPSSTAADFIVSDLTNAWSLTAKGGSDSCQ